MCNIENLFDTNIRNFDAKKRIFLPRMLSLRKSLGKVNFLVLEVEL